MKPESIFRNHYRNSLMEAFPEIFLEPIQQVAIRGTADYVGALYGRCLWHELKTDDGVEHPLQEAKRVFATKAGAFGAIVRPSTLPDMIAAMKELEAEAKRGTEALARILELELEELQKFRLRAYFSAGSEYVKELERVLLHAWAATRGTLRV